VRWDPANDMDRHCREPATVSHDATSHFCLLRRINFPFFQTNAAPSLLVKHFKRIHLKLLKKKVYS
jgi:hypothetical protein